MTRKKRRALLCMLAVPLLALAPRSEESLPASAAEPAAVPEKYVALTFDDGPWPETTEQLLDGLTERGAKATFFLIGEQLAGHEDTVRRMYQARINIPMQRREVAKPQETNLEQAKAAGGPSGPKRVQKKIGRNDPCPCGSGKKYKNCCGKDDG